MKTLFEMPFVFSKHISPNEGFRSKFLEICGQKYERPQVVVVEKYSEENRYGKTEWLGFIFGDGVIHKTFPNYIENIPSDKDIAKNKKIFEFWKSTNEQIKQGGAKCEKD